MMRLQVFLSRPRLPVRIRSSCCPIRRSWPFRPVIFGFAYLLQQDRAIRFRPGIGPVAQFWDALMVDKLPRTDRVDIMLLLEDLSLCQRRGVQLG